jgi:hypothetical protein
MMTFLHTTVLRLERNRGPAAPFIGVARPCLTTTFGGNEVREQRRRGWRQRI